MRCSAKETIEEFHSDILIAVIEKVCRVNKEEFCGSGKSRKATSAKEMLVLTGCRVGASLKELSEVAGLSRSAVSRRKDAALLKLREQGGANKLADRIVAEYRRELRIAKSQA